MRELVDSGRYDTHDNFTVVLQPFMREVYLPRLEVRGELPDAYLLGFFFICTFARVSLKCMCCLKMKGRPPWSLVLHARLFPSQPESSHYYGSRSLEQHGRISLTVSCVCILASTHNNSLKQSLSWSQWATRLLHKTLMLALLSWSVPLR